MLTTTSTHQRRHLPGGRPFHLILLALATSALGDWLYNVALLALVFGRTGSATWVALTTAARVLPIVVLGPLGGVLADRHDRRALMIGADAARMALMAALAVVAAAGLPIVLVPLLAALATAASTVTSPSVAASTARLVHDDELQSANALRSAIGQAAIVAGPALGAVILALSGPAVAILVNAATFAVSAAAVLAIGRHEAFRPRTRTSGETASLLAELSAGARALRGAPVAIRLVAGDVLCSGVYGLLTVLLVMVSRQVGAGDGGYGILLGGFGAGGLVGAAIMSRANSPATWRRTLAVALGLVAASLGALGQSTSLVQAVVLAVLGGGGMIVGEVLSETALPRMLDDDVLGRAYGLAVPVSLGGIVVGSLVAGPLVSLLGLHGAFAAAGGFVALGAALLLHRPLALAPAPAPVAPVH
ncbi:MAG TPA: MFS transporter [Solirubrobacteraceae bacterium]|nr:MFS transporter [Solirubrobacteraceae bacterium]